MARRLKLAFVAPSSRRSGGQAVAADRLLAAWRNDPEVDAWLVPSDPDPPELLRWVLHVGYLPAAVTAVTNLPRLVRELAKADVVHVFSTPSAGFLMAPLPAMLMARALGRPVVLDDRSGEAPDHVRSAITGAAIRRVDLNVVPSRSLVEVFRASGLDATVVPDTIDRARFCYRERRPLRPRLVSIRNFDALANVATTIRAFRIVQDRWPEASLTLVGRGPQEAELRALAEQLRLRHVSFVGRMEAEDIGGYYASNDIYIQSPNIDNVPTPVIEAFASGLPVVSTAAGGVATILTHGTHGLLAALADYETLGYHVVRLLDNPDYARSLARTAYATTDASTWPVVREQWFRAYRGVMAQRSHAAAREVASAVAESSR
jgi:glycosyltransferase involved in cell wall biosynthesis